MTAWQRIRMRRDAMFHSVVSGMSQDHILVSCVTREGEILNTLRRNLPNVTAVHVPRITCGALMAVVAGFIVTFIVASFLLRRFFTAGVVPRRGRPHASSSDRATTPAA